MDKYSETVHAIKRYVIAKIEQALYSRGKEPKMYAVEQEIKSLLQSADVAPVVHAKWIICSDGYYPYCSNCRKEPKGGMSNYCPYCGAKMDLED